MLYGNCQPYFFEKEKYCTLNVKPVIKTRSILSLIVDF